MTKNVLFVCLGNICRSPIAEAVFNHLVKERGESDQWKADSCATGDYHNGSQPDRRAKKCIQNYGIEYKHKARQICEEDFVKFDYILAMDSNNINDIEEFKPANSKAIIKLLGDYHPSGECIIEDPYYDKDEKGFEETYQRCVSCITAFLDLHQK